jgi:hypothetical protein
MVSLEANRRLEAWLPTKVCHIYQSFPALETFRFSRVYSSLNSVIPIVASTDSEWIHLIPQIDVLIDAAARAGPDACYATISAVTSALEIAVTNHERLASLKLTYIFTSGTWCHGDNINTTTLELSGSVGWKDERNARYDDSGLVSWRPQVEQTVISSTIFHGIVIRPALVYGRSASIIASMFGTAYEAAKAGKDHFEWGATPGKRWGLIHHDDLAELFLGVGEAVGLRTFLFGSFQAHSYLNSQAPITKGLIFDAVNQFSESVEDILSSLATILRTSSLPFPVSQKFHHIYVAPATPFQKAVDTHAMTRPSLGKALVGWVPQKRGLVDGLGVYFEAWRASAEEQQ